MSVLEVGCCGAYCGTCREYTGKKCRGCKTGYDNGVRDITKARCPMKVCCIQRELQSCGDCPDYATCDTIKSFHGKKGYKYTKYHQALEHIRENGYTDFLKKTSSWRNASGKLD